MSDNKRVAKSSNQSSKSNNNNYSGGDVRVKVRVRRRRDDAIAVDCDDNDAVAPATFTSQKTRHQSNNVDDVSLVFRADDIPLLSNVSYYYYLNGRSTNSLTQQPNNHDRTIFIIIDSFNNRITITFSLYCLNILTVVG
jgi:hypothetical protein